MSQINFGSTYRIPISQAGVNSAKKEKLRTLVESYDNGLIGKSKTGYARVSVPDSQDNEFTAKLKGIGYKVFQKFEGENISKENIDTFIKEKLDTRDYNQKGRKMKRMTREMKEQRRYERSIDAPIKSKVEPQADDVDILNNEQLPEIVNEQIQVEKEVVKPSKDDVRNSQDFLRIKELYGQEFAEAMFFGRK